MLKHKSEIYDLMFIWNNGKISPTYEYSAYRHMKQRCLNPNNPKYPRYGGRGIKICKRWLGENGFIKWMSWWFLFL
jgi:hypothetical protein